MLIHDFSLEEIVRRINLWQSYPLVHQLTCGNNSMHENLIPIIENEKVILKCPTCAYVQDNIPDYFFTESFYLDNINIKMEGLL